MTEAYAIQDPNGVILRNTIDISERATQREVAQRAGTTWDHLETRGYRCIKVRITPVEESK